MPIVTIEDHERFAVVRMNNKITNAINPELVTVLSSTLEQARQNYKGLILAGGNKFFCIGFDVPMLVTMGRDEMERFLSEFDQLTFDLFTAPMPTISLMAGHAIGGGNILALTCDFRVAAGGQKRIGLNEVKLGLPVPYLPDLILRQLIGDIAATAMLYHGELVSMAEANHTGLVDEVVPEDEADDHVYARMEKLLAFPVAGLLAIKANRVEAIRTRWLKNHQEKRQVFLDCWFSQAVQDQLREAAKKF